MNINEVPATLNVVYTCAPSQVHVIKTFQGNKQQCSSEKRTETRFFQSTKHTSHTSSLHKSSDNY